MSKRLPPLLRALMSIIERCWGILEKHWNGTQLKTAHDVLHWAGTMTWKTISPVVQFIDKVYSKGVTLTKQAFVEIPVGHRLH